MSDINHHHVFGSQDFLGMVLIKVFSCRVPGDLPLIPKNIKLKKQRGGEGGGKEVEGRWRFLKVGWGKVREKAYEHPRIAVEKQQGTTRKMTIRHLKKKERE